MAKCKNCGKKGKVAGTGWCAECTDKLIAKSQEKYKGRDMAKEFSEASKLSETSTAVPCNQENAATVKLFCPECGASAEGMKFCSECGASLVASVSAPAPADSAEASCPKCGSTSLSADKKGFGVGKAAAGALLTGGIGLAAGAIGAKKIRITCLKCGKQWIAGK